VLTVGARHGGRVTSALGRTGTLLLLASFLPVLVTATPGIQGPLAWTRILGLISVRDALLVLAAALALAGMGRTRGEVRDRVLVLLVPFAAVALAQSLAQAMVDLPFANGPSPVALLAAVAVMIALPLVTTGLALAGLRARENLKSARAR